MTVAGVVALVMYATFPRAPATFHSVDLLTPEVVPIGENVATGGKGAVRIRATVESPLDPSCLGSTQYFVEFMNGDSWAVAGARYTTPGETKVAVYQAPIPRATPPGRALFFVRDTYNCGLRVQRVQSPKVAIHILPPPTE